MLFLRDCRWHWRKFHEVGSSHENSKQVSFKLRVEMMGQKVTLVAVKVDVYPRNIIYSEQMHPAWNNLIKYHFLVFFDQLLFPNRW